MSKIILITGGSRGIGAATARLAAARGYTPVITYIENSVAANEVVAEITASGGDAHCWQLNVADEKSVMACFEAIDRDIGPLSGLVNNAGILDVQCRLEDMSLERLTRMFSVNVTGSFLCAREAVKRLSTRHGGVGGSIVNISSAASRIGSPNEFIDYAASKAAIDTLTIGLSKEVAEEGIRVNTVRPGLIETDLQNDSGDPARVANLQKFVPMQRGGTAEEVANAVVWLLSEEASYVTGALLDVTGGR